MYHAFPRRYVGYGNADGVDFAADSIAGDQWGVQVEGVGEQTAAPAGWQTGAGQDGKVFGRPRTHLGRKGGAIVELGEYRAVGIYFDCVRSSHE
jgi:hypothetical protein